MPSKLPSKGNQVVFLDPREGLDFDWDVTITRIVGTKDDDVWASRHTQNFWPGI